MHVDLNHTKIKRDNFKSQKTQGQHHEFWVIPIESTAKLSTIGEGLESINDFAPLGLETWI